MRLVPQQGLPVTSEGAPPAFPPCAWGACFISMPGPVGPRTPLTAASLSQAATGPGAAGTPGVGAEASRGAWRAAWKGQLGQGVEWIGVVVLKGGREGPPPKWEDETRWSTHRHTHTPGHTCLHAHTHTPARLHAHMHTHTHTHTHSAWALRWGPSDWSKPHACDQRHPHSAHRASTFK